MTNQLILLKLMQRLDKLGSEDYENVEQWMYIEAFNKGHIQFVRRGLVGINQERTGAEGSIRRIDDLQYLLLSAPLTMAGSDIYWSGALPIDYMEWSRISAEATSDCCPCRPLIIYLASESDRDILLNDSGKQPNYDWATTFATVISNNVRIYTNALFDITKPVLTYYKTPINIEINGIANPVTGNVSTTDVLCEAPDNVIELIIEEAAKILAGDIQNYNLAQSLGNSVDKNT